MKNALAIKNEGLVKIASQLSKQFFLKYQDETNLYFTINFLHIRRICFINKCRIFFGFVNFF